MSEAIPFCPFLFLPDETGPRHDRFLPVWRPPGLIYLNGRAIRPQKVHLDYVDDGTRVDFISVRGKVYLKDKMSKTK